MTNSMTAYAQAKTDTELGELSCELRSVNHRYLEVAPKMPEELRVHEGALRELVSKKLARGRVDCFIRLKENEATNLEPNIQMAENLEKYLCPNYPVAGPTPSPNLYRLNSRVLERIPVVSDVILVLDPAL